jgi:hypothetical protein
MPRLAPLDLPAHDNHSRAPQLPHLGTRVLPPTRQPKTHQSCRSGSGRHAVGSHQSERGSPSGYVGRVAFASGGRSERASARAMLPSRGGGDAGYRREGPYAHHEGCAGGLLRFRDSGGARGTANPVCRLGFGGSSRSSGGRVSGRRRPRGAGLSPVTQQSRRRCRESSRRSRPPAPSLNGRMFRGIPEGNLRRPPIATTPAVLLTYSRETL